MRRKFFYLFWRRQLAACQRLKYASYRGSLGARYCPRSTTASHSVSVNWTHNLPIERWTLPLGYLRRQFLGVRWCYDVQLGRYWETKDTRKRIKLALTISVISSKIVQFTDADFERRNNINQGGTTSTKRRNNINLSDFERRNNINRKHLEPKVFSLRSNAISFLCVNDFWLRWLKWLCLARKV